MRKIPTLFVRDPDDRRYVTDQVTPGCEWVFDGEGMATRKYDGTCVLIGHTWYDGPQVTVQTRREVKPGQQPPPMFMAVETDPATGKTVGWVPYADSSFARWIEEAMGCEGDSDWVDPANWPEGTYELCGPKINGNPEGLTSHHLIRHATAEQYWSLNRPHSFELIRVVTLALPWEGIVWHHPDGRMAKIKRRDFKEPA